MTGLTLLDRCAWAATAGEARFRIQEQQPRPRAGCLVSLDPGAAAALSRLPETGAVRTIYDAEHVPPDAASSEGVSLRDEQGHRLSVHAALRDVDLVMMVATTGPVSSIAAAISAAARDRSLMTSAFVLGGEHGRTTIAELRPHAQMLLVGTTGGELSEILAALRA